MAFEDLKAEILVALDALREPDSDAHESYERIRQTLDTMRAEGLPLPDDLVDLERELERLFEQQLRASAPTPDR